MPAFSQYQESRLSNGIPVVFQNYDGPVSAVYWWIRAGSCDEKPREAGFAHFLEHMLFKDAAAKETGRPSTGQTAQAIEALGGDINAYTSFDQTVYHVTCAEHHWEKILHVFGKMARPQKFLKSDFEREREVILEELRKNQDSPGRQLFENLFQSTFSKHPYGKPVIGFVKTLKDAKVGELEAFYQRNYVSDNMGIIMVGPLGDTQGKQGDTRKKKLISILEKYFGRTVIKPKPMERFQRPAEVALRTVPQLTAKKFDVKTPSFSYSFRVPDLRHEDTPALDLMAGVLGMGEVSRLYQTLFYQHALATDVAGGLYVPLDPGMMYFQAEVDSPSKIAPLSEKFFEELVRIREEGVQPEELERIIVNAESEKLYATQSADGLAGRVGFLRFVVNDLDFDRKYIDELRAVDSARIREVAEKYFDPRRMAGSFLIPKDADYSVKPLAELAKEKLKIPVRKNVRHFNKKETLGLKIDQWKTSHGIQVVYHERPNSHVVGVHAAVLGGSRLELAPAAGGSERRWGLTGLLGNVWSKGTQSRSALQVAKTVEGKAASLEGFSGRNSTGLQLTGLSRDWKVLSDLFSEVLVEPGFPDDEIEHARRVTLDEIKGIEDHSSRLCSKLFNETLFEHHPYGKTLLGSPESVSHLNRQMLFDLVQEWIRPERLVISVSGSVRRHELEVWLDQLDRNLAQARKSGQSLGDFQIEDESPLKAPRWIYKNLGREQLHIIVGSLGIRLNDEDRFAVRILQNILGGQSGRLFIELREKKSMAYTVAPMSMEGLERGYVGTYIACAPNKKDEALKGIQVVLETLAKKGPSPKEMERAKEYYLGQRAMELQSDSALAGHFGLQALYGLPLNSDQALMQKIKKVTAKDIQRVCDKYLVKPFQVTSVVG